MRRGRSGSLWSYCWVGAGKDVGVIEEFTKDRLDALRGTTRVDGKRSDMRVVGDRCCRFGMTARVGGGRIDTRGEDRMGTTALGLFEPTREILDSRVANQFFCGRPNFWFRIGELIALI